MVTVTFQVSPEVPRPVAIAVRSATSGTKTVHLTAEEARVVGDQLADFFALPDPTEVTHET